MIDAIDLAFLQHLADLPVQRAGGVKIVAERLLKNHPAPVPVLFTGQF